MRVRHLVLPALAAAGFASLGEYLSRRDPERFDPLVECSRGHRYRTIWIPGGSLKAVRWFNRRLQWCPVGQHWSWVRRIDPDRLSDAARGAANAIHDLRLA